MPHEVRGGPGRCTVEPPGLADAPGGGTACQLGWCIPLLPPATHLNNGLDILTVPAYWQNVIKGIRIIAAVAVDTWSSRRNTA